MDAKELKEYIISNNNVDVLLNDLGFHKIKDNGDYISCAVPEYNNASGFSVVKETLYCNSFTTHMAFKGGIFDLVMQMRELDFNNCLRYIHKLYDIPFIRKIGVSEEKDSILNIYKKYISKPNKSSSKTIKTYTDEYMNSIYVKFPYIKWVNEGILPTIQEEFGIGFHSDSNRVVIPHRMWNSGEYVGLVGRTLRNDTEIELFGIPKYFPIIAYSKSSNLYGLYENMKYIKEKGEVIVFEAEKSVLKMASKGIRNCVAVCCHEISEEQIKILISLDVNIVIAFDNDVEEEFILNTCSKFKNLRNLFYIYDKLGLMKEKDSPADKHYKVWNVLYNRKIKYKSEV